MPGLLGLLEVLLTKSQTWKGLIQDIKNKIMPLYPDYKHLCPDPKPAILQTHQPRASSSRPQASSPPPAPVTPILSLSAQPTSVQDKESLQFKTELLKNPALAFGAISPSAPQFYPRPYPQSPTASQSRNPNLLEDGFEYLRQTPFNLSSQKSATAYFGQNPPSPLRWTTDPAIPWESPAAFAFNHNQPPAPAPLLPSATINPKELLLASAPCSSPFIPSQRQDDSNQDDPMEDKGEEDKEDKGEEDEEDKDDKDDEDEEDEEEKEEEEEEEKI